LSDSIRKWVGCGFAVASLLWMALQPIAAQDPAGSLGESEPAMELPEVSVAGDAAATGSFTLPPELQKQSDEAVATFEKKHAEFEQAVGEMRETYIRFVNGLDNSPQAKERYWQRRNIARQKMNETYDAAMIVFQFMPDQAAAQFMATVVQHRAEREIYQLDTAEGAAKLIDAGVNFLFLFQAAARSAVVSGQFDLARKIYAAIEEEKLEDVDRSLLAQIDALEASYLSEQEILEKERAEDRLPRVRLKTTRGDVVLELFLDNAPSTVSNFIALVESHFYDGLDFYQVIDHLLALTGDPSGVGGGNSGKNLVDEHDRPDARQALRGSLVMAKLPTGVPGKFVPDSASSQFAILFLPMPHLTGQQTVFGRVIEGMDVISSLRRVDPNAEKKKTDVVAPPDRILSAEVIRGPEKLPEPVYAP
jgi:cyclophilin family peptidyl-prolyl cis-trans isomerase